METNKDSKITRFLLRHVVIIIGIVIFLTVISLGVESLIVFNEETQVATLYFGEAEQTINPTLYSFISIFATFPLVTFILVGSSLLGLYVKMNIEQRKSKRDLDAFMLLMARKAMVDLGVRQKQVDEFYTLSLEEKNIKKQEIRALSQEFNAFTLETEDTSNLTVDEQIYIKENLLSAYREIETRLSQVGETLQLKKIAPLITMIAKELEDLYSKKVV